MLTRKVMKLMESETKLKELQNNCLNFQQEVKDWKKKANSLAKTSKNLAELVKTRLVKPRELNRKKMCCVNVQVGSSLVGKDVQAKDSSVFKIPQSIRLAHPAPLPESPPNGIIEDSTTIPPPKLKLNVTNLGDGIQLFWTLDDNTKGHSDVQNYEIYAYLETSKPPSVKFWKKIGDIKAIPLPIRCTLSQFRKGSKYHFSVRARDVHSHFGVYSEIKSVLL